MNELLVFAVVLAVPVVGLAVYLAFLVVRLVDFCEARWAVRNADNAADIWWRSYR